jgi:hypothetical protein
VSTAQLSNGLLPKARSGTAKIGDHARARALELSPHQSRARAGARGGQGPMKQLVFAMGQDQRREGRTA